MVTLQQVARYLDNYLACREMQDFCLNGVQVQGKEEIRSIATAVTASLETIRAACELDVDALIVHHGLFWDRQQVAITSSLRTKLTLLLEREISLMAYHLPLDAHHEVGNNWVAARELGLVQLRPFGRCNGVEIGVRGMISGVEIEAWVAHLERYYAQPARVALGGPSTFTRVGIISGGAHRQLSEAIEAGLDCFITGTGDEPNWHMAMEEGIHFLALGHSATERVGPRALCRHLQDRFEIEATFIADTNPF